MNARSGFTLIEMLTVVAVLTILVTIGIPNFRTLIQNNRATSQANELLTMLQYARSEALKRGRPVSVCRSNNGTTCGGTWAEGWIAYVDGNAPGATGTAVAEVLRVWQGVGHGTAVVTTNMPAANFLRFLPSGLLDPLPTAYPVTFRVRVAGCRGDAGRDVAVARTGRATIERVACT
jgi:type IV fimbrial biogenesis protein FimT